MAPDQQSLPSSPDPLALSNENIPTPSPTKLKSKTPVITPRKPLVDTTGNARVQEFLISTPKTRPNGKSSSRSSNHDAATSPWRIRVTLQAEEVDDGKANIMQTTSGPSRFTEHTTTINVPLRDSDDTSPAPTKRGRGRPRKSLDSPKKRSGTPRPKSNGMRRTLPDTEEAPGNHAPSGRGSPPKKSRRSRKSTESGPPDSLPEGKHSTTIYREDVEESVRITDSRTRTRSRKRRKEISPRKITRDSDFDDGHLSPVATENAASENMCEPSPKLVNDFLEPQILQPTTQEEIANHSPDSPNFQESSSNHNVFRRDNSEQVDADPTNEHQEYDTILESEGFSMVSMDSLASSGSHSNPSNHTAEACTDNVYKEHTPVLAPVPSMPPAFEFGNVHSCQRELEKYQEGTPKLARVVRAGIALQGVLSPRNQGEKHTLSPRACIKSSPLLNAERSIGRRQLSARSAASESPKERMDNLFSGFGAGTRRELRAGFRLGEELAKRHRDISQASTSSSKLDGDVFNQPLSNKDPQSTDGSAQRDYSLKLPSPRETSSGSVKYPSLTRNQLPTPERSDSEANEDAMSWKESTPMKSEHADIQDIAKTPRDQESDPEANLDDNHKFPDKYDYVLETEAEFQREREAVSRQIEMANKSQVIIIDSDSDEDEGNQDEDSTPDYSSDRNLAGTNEQNTSDIWQAEAYSADNSQTTVSEVSTLVLQLEAIKPRRSKLPSHWRRTGDVRYSDEIEPSDADLFWQPSLAQKKVKSLRQPYRSAAEVKEKLEEVSSTSLTTPVDCSKHETEQSDDSTGALIASQLGVVRARTDIKTKTASTSETKVITTAEIDNTNNRHSGISPDESLDVAPEHHYEGEPSKFLDEDTETPSDLVPSIDNSPQKSDEDDITPIDPLLLHPRKQYPQTDARQQQSQTTGPRPPLIPCSSPSSSLFSFITRPLTSLFTASTSLPPPATKADILLSSPYEPLCQFTPFSPCHMRALQPLCLSALLFGPHIFKFIPDSPSAKFLDKTARNRLGWERRVTRTDCRVTDAFMVLLNERGYALPDPTRPRGGAWIDAGFVVGMCVELWMLMCMRGELEVRSEKGEKSGLRWEGDQTWVPERDIDWSKCGVERLERQRREWKGLPSWEEKGFKWSPVE